MSTPCRCMKGLLSIALVGLFTSFVCLNSRAADWIDEDQSADLRDALPDQEDSIDSEFDDADFDPFQSADDEIAFDQEDDSLSDLNEDGTEADPASYRRGDQGKARGDRKRGDRKRGEKKRGDKKRGKRLGRKGKCPFCQKGASDSPRHAYRDRGRHEPGHRAHGPGAPGHHDMRQGARMMMHRLSRLEHKVDMLLRMTHRAHVHHSRAYSADGGHRYRARGAKAGESSGCKRCEGRASRGDRGHRHGGEAHDAGPRHRHRARRHHDHDDGHGDREGQPERRRHRPHRPAEWDAPPGESWRQADYDRSASYDDRSGEDDVAWDEASEAEQNDLLWHDDVSIAESLERLEHYFDDAFDIPR